MLRAHGILRENEDRVGGTRRRKEEEEDRVANEEGIKVSSRLLVSS